MLDLQFNLEAAYAHCADLSRSVLGMTAPNPNVSVVIYSATGELIADGVHNRKVSPDHAEVVALRRAGNAAEGATLVASLEPCNHIGATGPCVDAIIAAKIARVIYAVRDPNPIAAGGAERLKAAGIAVESIESDELRDIHSAWLHRIATGRPYFIWKIATTLDGFIAASDGTSQWISSPESRADVQLLRSQSDAILIGTGTALADNPTLQARIASAAQPLRVVMGERNIPADFNINNDVSETLLIQSRDLNQMLQELSGREINQLLVEAGPTLGTALIKAGIIDEIIIYQAPILLGSGKSWLQDLGISTLAKSQKLNLISTENISGDIKARYRVEKS